MDKLLYLILLLLTACQPIQADDVIIDNDIAVNEMLWAMEGNATPYPFTVEYGNIACSMNEVYFYPDNTANDESQLGQPVNRLAQLSLERDNMTPTVANTIKANADLSDVIKIGLNICKQVNLQFSE